jgi:hypothetical protein
MHLDSLPDYAALGFEPVARWLEAPRENHPHIGGVIAVVRWLSETLSRFLHYCWKRNFPDIGESIHALCL